MSKSRFYFLDDVIIDNFFMKYKKLVELLMDVQRREGYNYSYKTVEDYLNRFRKSTNIDTVINKLLNSNPDVETIKVPYKFLSNYSSDNLEVKNNIGNIVKIEGAEKFGLEFIKHKTIDGLNNHTAIEDVKDIYKYLSNVKIPNIKSNTPKDIYNKIPSLNNNVLVIADIHEPFSLDAYFDFCVEMKHKYNTDHTVFIGDIIDDHYHSFHSVDPDGYSAGDELRRAKDRLQKWHSEFPNAVVTMGNHDIRFYRKAYNSGLSKEWIKDIKDVLETPTWKYVDEYDFNGVSYVHGYEYGEKAAYNRALYKNKSVVQGHLHTQGSIHYVNNNIFGMIVGCVDKDTEYLTEFGWKKISEYNNENVAQYIDGSIEFVKPINYIKVPETKFNYIKTKYGVSQKICDAHDFAYLPRRKDKLNKTLLKIKPAELIDRINRTVSFQEYIVTTFSTNFTNTNNLNEIQWRLLVAFIADGTFMGNKCRFIFKKERKINRLEYLLNELKLEYKKVNYKDGTTNISFEKQPYMVKHFYEIENVYKLHSDVKNIILQECLVWDGDQKKRLSTSIKLDADIIQYFANSTGRTATIYTDSRIGYKNDNYNVLFSNRRNVTISSTRKDIITEIQSEDGYKYCFTVPSGLLLLRCENDIFVTGNCGIDESKYAFNYAKGGKRPNILGCGIILGKTPILETMKNI